MNTQRREEIRAMIVKPNWFTRDPEFRDALAEAMDWIDQLEAKAAERVISNGAKYTAPDYHPEKNGPFEKAMSAILDCHARNDRAIVKLPDGTRMEFHPDGTQTHLPPEDEMPGPVPDYTGEGSAWIPPKTKPHTFAKMVNEVRDLAFDFGTSEQFRDRVADLLGKYICVEHGSKGVPEQTEARAVVVPDLEDGDDAWQDAAFKGANYSAGLRDGYNLAKSRARAIPADRVLGDGQERIHAESESPTEKGWYECWAVDGRWGMLMQYRAWGNGCWWTPLADGWVSSKNGVYKWRGPVADIGGPAPDGTNPGSLRTQAGKDAT